MLRFLRVLTAWVVRVIRRLLSSTPSPQASPARHGYRKALPAPPRHWRRKPEWVVHAIIRMQALANLSCAKLAAHFNRIHAQSRQMTVSKSWVAEQLKKHRYQIERLRERFKRRVPRAMPRNRIWAIDMTGKADERGLCHTIVGLIDHGSRRALALEPLRDRTAIGLLKIVIAAVEEYGKPRILRTDNDSIFRSREFIAGLKALGIRQQFTKPGCPWQNGIVERLFGTLKEKLDQFVVADAKALRHVIATFKDWYNEVRPHNHLNGLTPVEAWEGVNPYSVAPKSVEFVDELHGLLTGFRIRR